jgi:hypothetical protein
MFFRFMASPCSRGGHGRVLIAVVVVAFCAFAANLLFAGVGGLLGDPRVTWPGLVRSLPAAVFYDVLLTPFGRLARRRAPAATPWRPTAS